MKALGLDMSATKTGLVLLQANGTKTPDLLREEVLKKIGAKHTGIERAHKICEHLLELIHAETPDIIVIEGYSLGKNANSTIPLVELGGIFRFLLRLDGLKWLDPRAGQVKKFCTGNGGAQKSQMMMHVLKRWGHEAIDDNTADAYALACIGLAYKGQLPGLTGAMREVIGELKMVSN